MTNRATRDNGGRKRSQVDRALYANQNSQAAGAAGNGEGLQAVCHLQSNHESQGRMVSSFFRPAGAYLGGLVAAPSFNSEK